MNKIEDFETFFKQRLKISALGINAIVDDVIKTYIEIGNFNLDDFLKIEDKTYPILELIFYKTEKRQQYQVFQEIKPKLEELIETNLNSNNIFKIQLIFRYIQISAKYGTLFKELDSCKLNYYFENLYSIEQSSNILIFFKMLFKDSSKGKLFEFLKKEFNKIESNYFSKQLDENYIDNSIILGQDNLELIGDVLNIIGETEKAILYYQALINQSIKISQSSVSECSNPAIKLYCLNRMLTISKNKAGGYKIEELKKLYIDKDITDILYGNMHSIDSPEIDKMMIDILYSIILELDNLNTNEKILESIFLVYLHFEFIEISIKENCVEKQKRRLVNIMEMSEIIINESGHHKIMKDSQKIEEYYKECISDTANFTLATLQNIDLKFEFIEKTYLTLIDSSKEISIISNSHKIFAEKSITYFRNKDYIEFMHLATPLIEHILRNYLQKIDGDSLSFRDNSNDSIVQAKTLDDVIRIILNSSNNYLDNAMLSFFQTILTKDWNLRNNIAHGFLKEEDFNPQNSMAIFSILAYLITYFKNDERE